MSKQPEAVRQVRPPDKKPEGGLNYSTAKPVTDDSWKSKDERTRIFQMLAEIKKAMLLGEADIDNAKSRKAMCERIYAATDEIKLTC